MDDSDASQLTNETGATHSQTCVAPSQLTNHETQQIETLLTEQHIGEILAHHRHVLQQMGVLSIGLFGSYRRGTATSASDISLLH